MCGIVGVMRGKSLLDTGKQNLFFEQALVADCFRGLDSTGMFSVGDQDEVCRVFKKAMNPLDFIQLQGYRHISDIRDAYVMVGHNRHKTMGIVNDEHAHPFQVGPITMVHNGTLTNSYDLPFKHPDIVLDSAHIAAGLAKHEDPLDVLPLLGGAYMLVWYDARTNCLHFARNNTRSFYFTLGGKTEWKKIRKKGKVKAHKELILKADGSAYFASERGMLDWLLSRNDIEHGTFYYPKPFHLYSLPLDNAANYTEVEYKDNPSKWKARGAGHYDYAKGVYVYDVKTGAAAQSASGYSTPTSQKILAIGRTPTGSTQQTGGPTGTTVDRHKEGLKRLGYEIGQQLSAESIAWTPYHYANSPKIPMGYSLLSLFDDDDSPYLECHGIAETVHKYSEDLEIAFVKITGLRTYTPRTGEMPTIMVKMDWDAMKEYEDALKEPDPDVTTITEADLLPGPFGILMPQDEWEKRVAKGCGNCTANCNPNYASQMLWHGEDPICHECSKDKKVMKDLGII